MKTEQDLKEIKQLKEIAIDNTKLIIENADLEYLLMFHSFMDSAMRNADTIQVHPDIYLPLGVVDVLDAFDKDLYKFLMDDKLESDSDYSNLIADIYLPCRDLLVEAIRNI